MQVVEQFQDVKGREEGKQSVRQQEDKKAIVTPNPQQWNTKSSVNKQSVEQNKHIFMLKAEIQRLWKII